MIVLHRGTRGTVRETGLQARRAFGAPLRVRSRLFRDEDTKRHHPLLAQLCLPGERLQPRLTLHKVLVLAPCLREGGDRRVLARGREGQRLLRCTRRADPLAQAFPQEIERAGGGRVRARGGGGALQILLQRLGIIEHAEHVRLPHARGAAKRAAVQPKEARAVRRPLVQDLVRVVPAGEVGIRRAAVRPVGQILQQFDTPPVRQGDRRGDHPVATLVVPRSVAILEVPIRPSRPFATAHPAQPGVQRGVPRRLAGLVRAVDDGHPGSKIEHLVLERPEGMRAD